MTRLSSDDPSDTWYLDSCASRHICNNRELFSDLRPKNYEFVTAGGEIIRSQEVGTVHLPLQSGTTMTLLNVAYTSKCDSNLILLGQLRESRISYHDHPDSMVLKQGGGTLGMAGRHKNLFVLETGLRAKAMLVRGRGRPTYLLSSNPQVRLWHRRLGHASNARVIQASKLVDGINLGGTTSSEDEPQSSDSEPDDGDNGHSDAEADNEPTTINKAAENNPEGVEQLCEACIESKYTRIIKSKKMTRTTRRLQEVHADLWALHEPASISGKNYVALLLDEFTWKSWILLLKSRDEFFDAFKLWLPRAETCGNKLDCLRTDGGGEFISHFSM